MQESKSEVIRALVGRLPMPAGGQAVELKDLMESWSEFKRTTPIPAQAETACFAYWLIHRSGLVVRAETHRRELAHLRAELAGDKQVLLVVGEVARGRREFKLAIGSSFDFQGRGFCRPNLLPRWAKSGEELLVTISRPQCRNCGCGGERKCVGGCRWMLPNLCSKCWPQARRRRRL